jgi:hypothetical protein
MSNRKTTTHVVYNNGDDNLSRGGANTQVDNGKVFKRGEEGGIVNCTNQPFIDLYVTL